MNGLGALRVGILLAAVVVAGSACGAGDSGAPSREGPAASSSRVGATASSSVPSTQATTVVPQGNPSSSPATEVLGTAVIRTRTLSGTPVPNVPVRLSQVQPCDAASRDISPDAKEVLHREATTDGSGVARFSVPLGCYYFGLGTPPPGATPVPEGMHSLFLVRAGEPVSGELRFQEPLSPHCAAATIVHDLDDIGELTSYNAKVSECDGAWAVIVWDIHGDSQRIVRHAADGWATYVVFPHDICWSKAAADGVPARLRPYFSC
ncbi:hypothetical protein DFR70_10553 [Nocardia tenerifensis]|uniref:Uncharacterized protein n=1 Tax=Nocardia tenerifensis TaxID=228006 RepID=A0A318KD22_9NOCA|nr:hypothetical protein [Nocardia tenerifensis]PXX63871.1 hypothetical protein DFR70_10553 [Nocardia tenerifensis]